MSTDEPFTALTKLLRVEVGDLDTVHQQLIIDAAERWHDDHFDEPDHDDSSCWCCCTTCDPDWGGSPVNPYFVKAQAVIERKVADES